MLLTEICIIIVYIKTRAITNVLKTYAAISNAHLSASANGESCLGPVFRPLTDSDQHSFRYSYAISVFRHFLHKITN